MREVLTSKVWASGISLWSHSGNDLCLRCQETRIHVQVLQFTVILMSLLALTFRDSISLVYQVMPHISCHITAKELTLHFFVAHISNHKQWVDVRELSSHALGPKIMRKVLLMVGCLLFFSGPLGTRQLKPCKTWKALACMIYGYSQFFTPSLS